MLAEWYFRSSLDRYIWIWGMVCAYVHPTWDKFLQRVDSMQPALRRAVRAGMMAGAVKGSPCSRRGVWVRLYDLWLCVRVEG